MTDELKPRPERGCEHGLALHRARLPTGGWNGPVSYCECCQSYFGYIDSMSIGTGGAHGKTWTPKDRCAQCGGKYHDAARTEGKGNG